MYQTKDEIRAGLEEKYTAFTSFVLHLDKNNYDHSPDGKWTSGQHLEHLILAVKALNQAMKIPKIFFPMIWGRMKREGRDYDMLVKRYQEKLQPVADRPNPFPGEVFPFEQREERVGTYRREWDKLQLHLKRLSDRQLDSLVLPHPLLGKLSLREMMCFMIYHNEHHLQILQNRPSI